MPKRKLTQEEKDIRNAKMAHKQRLEGFEREINNTLKECKSIIKRKEIRTPTYFFNVGDRVDSGNWNWVHVLEICEDGMYYKILKITSKTAYGKYVGEEYHINYVMWYDIRPYRTTKEAETSVELHQKDDIRLNYSQRTISSLLCSFYSDHSAIETQPDYQRDLVWTKKQKESLIDSIFRNIDIGKFTFINILYEDGCPYHLEVLDGKQRIQAIIDFYECRFTYKGKTFNDLHWRDRLHFENYNISWGECSPLTNEQKYRYFLKLNVGGTPMDQKHIDKVFKMWQDEVNTNKK